MSDAPAPTAAGVHIAEDDSAMACAICLEDMVDENPVAQLPCCTIPPTATTQYCQRCLEVVCEHGPGGVGRCPNCRSYLRVCADRRLEVAEHTDTCSLCSQPRVIVEERGPMKLCDACLLGTRHSLRYECERCRRFQRIPHPMWRYQPTPNEFGDTTWFCHLECFSQTHWRIHEQDAASVPPHDCPESWGRRDEWLAAIREQRRREVRGGERPATAAAGRNHSREAKLLLLVAAVMVASSLGTAAVPLAVRWAAMAGGALWSVCG